MINNVTYQLSLDHFSTSVYELLYVYMHSLLVAGLVLLFVFQFEREGLLVAKKHNMAS